MKEKMVYSPKTLKDNRDFGIVFKKSPQKFAVYDSPHTPPPQIPTF